MTLHTDPGVASGRLARMAAPLAVAGSVGLATLALHVRDPHEQGSWGICPTAALGFWCPGCGGLRAVNDLTHGDLLAAASSNLAFVVALPFLVAGFLVWSHGRWRGRSRSFDWPATQALVLVVLALLAVFTVVRNLPTGAWLAP